MNTNGLDKRFRHVALDGLKSFRHTEFTVRFLKEHGISCVGKTLTQMWVDIQTWLEEGDDSRRLDLLEYVDDLKMWGRQRIFLFEINGTRKDLMAQLSDPGFVRGLVGDVYDTPVYRWEADEPFLAYVKHTSAPGTGDALLVFKLIEMRNFDLLIDDRLETYSERSTNFFIVNLRRGFAELRLQQLPTRAHRNLKEERQLFEKEITKYLGQTFDRFSPIPMVPIMSEMLRRPIYTITASDFIASGSTIPGTPTLAIVLNHLFKHPVPSHIAAYWKCKQNVLGQSRLHFRLYRGSKSIAVGGVADPSRVNDILEKIVDIHRSIGKKKRKSPWKHGWVDEPYNNLEGQPKAQAVVLSAGAIAALVIWIVIEGVGNYLVEGWIEKVLHGIPLVVITILIELIWIVRFYGWNRIKRSFGALWNLPLSEIWRMIKEERERGKAGYQDKDRRQQEESDSTDLTESEEDD